MLVDHAVAHLVPPNLPSSVTVVVSLDSGGQRKDDAYEAFLMRGHAAWQAAQHHAGGACDWALLTQPADELATCALCYTSGTTGRPKGVEYSFRGAYLSALGNVIESGLTGDSVYLWVLPMFHCCGWTFPWAVTAGMGTHYMLRQVDYTQIWDALLHGGVTHYSGAPTVQLGVVNAPQAKRLDHAVRVSVAASAPTATLLGRMEGLQLYPVHVYGLTETVRIVADAVRSEYAAVCRGGLADARLGCALAAAGAAGARDGHERRDARCAAHGRIAD